MNVPFIDLARQIAPIRSEIDAAIARVIDSGRFILGPEVAALEKEIAAKTGSAAAVGTSSGTDALLLALRSLGIGPGDVVVTTPFSFFATGAVIFQAGARPTFVDVDPETMVMDPEALEDLLSSAKGKKARAVMPVHLFGLMADMKRIRAAAAERGIPVIEDACQAIGASRDGLAAGAAGHAAGFSFFPTKNLGAFGDGGIVTTGDLKAAERIRRLRNHGSEAKNYHTEVGINGRLDELQAAILRVKLGRLDAWNEGRRRNAFCFNEAFAGTGGIVVPSEPRGARHIYHQYSLRVPAKRREAFRELLQKKGVSTDVYYPSTIHLQPALKGMGFRKGMFPAAERCAREVVSLPVFPEMTDEERRQVVDAVLEFAGAPAVSR